MLSRALPRLRRPLASLSRPASTSVAAAKPSIPAVSISAAQAPNLPSTWSSSQRPRADAHTEARFEQTALEAQPSPLSAMAMIAEEPIRIVHGRKASCDGGGGPLGHPKVYINLDKPGPKPCGYCGIRFEQAPHHHH